MFGIAPRRAHGRDIGVGTFTEGRNAVVLGALGLWVAACHQNLAELDGLNAGVRQRQVSRASKPQFGALAVFCVHENPAPTAMIVDEKVKTAAIDRKSTRLNSSH